MLSHLILDLDVGDANIHYNTGSSFQGVLMDQLDKDIADQLHNAQINPYSQWIEKDQNGVKWHISGMNKFAYDHIISPIMDLSKFEPESKEIQIEVIGRNLNTVDRQRFIEDNLFADPQRRKKLIFKTPTSFKSNNIYLIHPDLRLIFQSLMNKLEASGKEDIFSKELIADLLNHTYISSYKLRSTRFHLEKVKIPSFIGEINLSMNGPKNLTNIANLLLKFGEYSGVGIKTAMGMGSIKIGRR